LKQTSHNKLEPLPQESLSFLRRQWILGKKHEQELHQPEIVFSSDFPGRIQGSYRDETLGSGGSRAFYPPSLCLIAHRFPMPTAKKLEPGQNFESAMDRLEEIVEQMESGKMMLEELIVRYEEGMKLVKVCQERLASAEQRIEIITRNNAGKPIVKDFEPAVEKEPAAKTDEKGKTANDEVRLF
jgi:exodeoxyribonuclease VII small subunit